MSKIQDSDVKNQTEAGAASRLINDTKIYVTANSINKRLDVAITDGDIGGGGGALNYVSTSTTPYNITTANAILDVDASGGAKTVNLFAASGNSGRVLTITKTDSSSNKVTIDGNSTETIDGSTTLELLIQGDSVTIYCDGSNWKLRTDGRRIVSFAGTFNSGTHNSNGSFIDTPSYTETHDSHGAFSGATFTAPRTAKYQVNYFVNFFNNGTGARGVRLNYNSGTTLFDQYNAPDYGASISHIITMSSGDTFKTQAFQSSGGNLNYDNCFLSIQEIR